MMARPSRSRDFRADPTYDSPAPIGADEPELLVPNRRDFLRQLSALAGAFAASRLGLAQQAAPPASGATAKRSSRILFIGGTDFLGPPTVRRAIERGHVVTLFNRGRTHPTLFQQLERIKGDRNVDADLQQLAGREFDAVVDTCGYFPRQVRESAGVLAATTSQYVFVSTIAVYRLLDAQGAGEDAPLATLPPDVDAEKLKTTGDRNQLGALKSLCEQAAEKEMPGQVTNLRPGVIVGPDDDGDWGTYWPLRVAEGGEVLAPGTPKDPVQFIDVRDLGDFIIHCIENATVGVMNATGPQGGMPIDDLLQACKSAARSDARFTWVSDEFLNEQKIRGMIDLPCWTSPREPGGGITAVSVAKAVAAGLAFRPAVETARDTIDWFRKTQGRRALRAGLAREAEAKALAAWHAKNP